MNMDVSIDSISETGENSIGFEVTLQSLGVNDFRWSQPCRLTVSLYDESTGWPVSQLIQSCGEESGSRIRLQSQQSMTLDELFLDMKEIDQTALDEIATTCGATLINDQDIDQGGSLDGLTDQIAALDLVISVSTTTAHIAGALGQETWVIVPPVGPATPVIDIATSL